MSIIAQEIQILFGQVIKLAEAKSKLPGVMSLKGIICEQQLRRDLESYFKSLDRTISGTNLTLADNKAHAEALAKNIVRKHSVELETILKDNTTIAFLHADKQESFHEAEVDSDYQDYVGQTGEQAALWAKKNAAQKVVGIDSETVARIADTIGQGIEKQLTLPEVQTSLRGLIEDMSSARAKLIARTETADAFGEAALQKLQRQDIPGKQLIPSPDACPTCLGIVAGGPVPIDDPFVDDDGEEYDRSPIHPGCRCATVGARLEADSDDEDN